MKNEKKILYIDHFDEKVKKQPYIKYICRCELFKLLKVRKVLFKELSINFDTFKFFHFSLKAVLCFEHNRGTCLKNVCSFGDFKTCECLSLS